MTYRYYATLRPPKPGTIPEEPRPRRLGDYGRREMRSGIAAWGFVEYDVPLADELARACGLRRAK